MNSQSDNTHQPLDEAELRAIYTKLVQRYGWLDDDEATIAVNDLMAILQSHLAAAFETFFDTFEKEIDQQEFAIDEAEWMSLIQAMRLAERKALHFQADTNQSHEGGDEKLQQETEGQG